MRIAILGTGRLARALGAHWRAVGHEVRHGAADPAPDAPDAASPTTAVAGADIIVLALPWAGVPAALAACGDLAGRVLIDATNPLVMGPKGLELAVGPDTSGGEQVQALVPGAQVFKALNHMGAAFMAKATAGGRRPVTTVAGPETPALARVLGLIADLGFDARHGGELAMARLLEPQAMVWIRLAFSGRDPEEADCPFRDRTAEPA